VTAEFKKFDLAHVMPMHCSGQNFTDLAKREMPGKTRAVRCRHHLSVHGPASPRLMGDI
jgi:metal-dependent hydrolase (beta-lactamase superfamily II)